jgi:urea transporter
MVPQSGMPDIKPQIPPIPGLIEAFTGFATVTACVASIAIILAALFGALEYTNWAIRAGITGFTTALITILVGAAVDEWRPAIAVVASLVLAVVVAVAVTLQRRRDWSR